MKTLMIEATDRNYKLINKFSNITIHEFCGWLNIVGSEKVIQRIAKKTKVALF